MKYFKILLIKINNIQINNKQMKNKQKMKELINNIINKIDHIMVNNNYI